MNLPQGPFFPFFFSKAKNNQNKNCYVCVRKREKAQRKTIRVEIITPRDELTSESKEILNWKCIKQACGKDKRVKVKIQNCRETKHCFQFKCAENHITWNSIYNSIRLDPGHFVSCTVNNTLRQTGAIGIEASNTLFMWHRLKFPRFNFTFTCT